MDIETDRLIAALTDAEPVTLGVWKCVRGLLDGWPTVVVRTNQGMANAAAATALAIARFSPCAVLSQGTAGGHDPALHAGDLVIGARCVNMGAVYAPFAPAGAGVDLHAWRPLGLERASTAPGDGPKDTVFPADAGLLAAARAAARRRLFPAARSSPARRRPFFPFLYMCWRPTAAPSPRSSPWRFVWVWRWRAPRRAEPPAFCS